MTTALADGRIDPEEHETILTWCAGFLDLSGHKTLASPHVGGPKPIPGITATNHTIQFPNRTFCITGASHRATRKEITALILEKGGLIHNDVQRNTTYLIYCDAGQPAWAYACYGRKVEKAMQNRKRGTGQILIIAEIDFWDSI